ncbi:MAG: hypothetical protein WCG98_00105 [bacterium]
MDQPKVPQHYDIIKKSIMNAGGKGNMFNLAILQASGVSCPLVEVP